MGSGGMGTVYKAFHTRLHKVVAIKVLHRAEETALRRFAREMTLQARLSHPNICPVTDSGVSRAGRDYLVMDFIPGRPLSKLLGDPALTLERLATIVARVARALHYAHGHGVLHRDIKPDNVLVDDAGEPHVVDFGIARELSSATPLTAAGVAVGTPYYMAPEQIRCMNEQFGPRTDIYALGAVLFHAVSGAPPFRGGTHLDTLRRAVSDPVPPLRLPDGSPAPADLESIVRKAMGRDPEDRYDTAANLAADLESFAAGEPISLRPARRIERARWLVRRNRRAIRFGVAAIAVLTGALGSVTAVALSGAGGVPALLFVACLALVLGGSGLVMLVHRLDALNRGRSD
jgi:serine/threonine-protein kinase